MNHGREKRIDEYLEFLKTLRPPYNRLGDVERGEIQIETDPERIADIEQAAMDDFVRRGLDPRDMEVGIRHRDHVQVLVRDPVWIPDAARGKPRPYCWNRTIWLGTNSGASAIVVPMTEQGKLVVLPEAKHPARQMLLQWPGGESSHGDAEAVARAELIEEAGYELLELTALEDPSDITWLEPSTLGCGCVYFFARVGKRTARALETTEAIGEPLELHPEELVFWMNVGYATLPDGRRVSTRNAKLSHGYLMAKLRGFIP